MLPAFTCARVIGYLWSICLWVNILRPSPCFVMYLASDVTEEYSLNNLVVAFLDSESNLIFANVCFCSFDLHLPFNLN